MLHIRDFSKSYADVPIISVKALTFEPGIHWIKGENGSGKSTFFRSLAGLIPCKGNVEVDGTNLHRHPVAYRKIVNYSEAEPLYPGFLTARDLIRFVGEAKGAARQQQDSLVQKFGIDAYFENPCETYSSGMLKKLSLALAFLGAPRIIILDEPLITLDEQARAHLFELMEEHVQRNVTFLISSHQLIEATMLAVQSTYAIHNKTLNRI